VQDTERESCTTICSNSERGESVDTGRALTVELYRGDRVG